MKLGFSGLFGEAGALLRSNLDLLLRVGAVFFFLPGFAVELFVQPFEPGELTGEAQWAALSDWYVANIGWLLGGAVVQMFGASVMLVLLLDPARPALDAAILRALRLFPGLLAARILALLLAVAGLMLLIVPGVYAIGRTFVSGAAFVAEPGRGPIGAVGEGIRLTRGNGWTLVLALFAVSAVASLAGLPAENLARAGGPVLGALCGAVAAAAVGGASLAQLLLEAAAYRLLSSKGI